MVLLDSLTSSSAGDDAERQIVEEEILPDMSHNEDDHLDITLDDEAAFLAEYKSRLASLM